MARRAVARGSPSGGGDPWKQGHEEDQGQSGRLHDRPPAKRSFGFSVNRNVLYLNSTLSDCPARPRPGMNARATWETKSRLKPAPKSEPLLQEPGSPGFSVEA